MAKMRRVIRKLKTAGSGTFDEQLWPIYVALAVLAAYVVGIILSVPLLRFSNIEPMHNTATWLGFWLVTVGVVVWAVWQTRGRRVHRGVLLSLLLSLIINLNLLVVMTYFDIFHPPWLHEAEVAAPAEPRELVTEAVYQDYQTDPDTERPKQDFEKPLESESAEADEPEITREETTPEETETKPQEEPIPEPEKVVDPKTLTRRESPDSAPRRADEQSKLSRQLAKAQPRPVEPIAVPETEVEPQETPARIQANSTPLETKRASQVEVRRQLVHDEPATTTPQQQVKIARRETEVAPTPESTAIPTMRRQMATPKMVPRTRAETADASAVAQRTQPDAIRPSNTSADKRATAAPEMARQATEPTPAVSANVTQAVTTRQEAAEKAPTLAQTSDSVPNRRSATTLAPSADTTAARIPSTSAPTRPVDSTLAPSASSVARQATAGPATRQASNAAEIATRSPTARVATASPRRAEASAVPTLTPAAPAGESPSRAERSASIAASPTAVAQPAAVEAPRSTRDPVAQPARLALSKSVGGIAGIGQSPNLDRGLPAAPSPARVASASARRARATQRSDSGPAISPSNPAQLSRSRAGAALPSASFRADVAEGGQVAGTRVPTELTASASAALTRARSNAAEGAATAARGATDVDLGPTRIVSSNGRSRRAAGGGQLTLNFETQAQNIARNRSGGAPTASIVARAEAAAPEAPDGTSGGHPIETQLNIDATAATRTVSGGEVAVSGGPTSAELTGPTATAGSAQRVGAAELARAETIEASLATLRAGGGTEAPARAESGRRFVANLKAETVTVAGAPRSGGAADGVPLEAQGTEPVRAAAGILAAATGDPAGAIAGPTAVDAPRVRQIGSTLGRRRTSPATEDGPAVDQLAVAGGPMRKARDIQLQTGVAVEASTDAPTGPSSPTSQPDVEQLVGGLDSGSITRRTTGALPVLTDGVDGPGGLGDTLTPEAGLMSRRAQSESEHVSLSLARFVSRSTPGARLNLNSNAVVAAVGFRSRAERKGPDDGGGVGRPSAKTEEAIERGLVFLARHQSPDGSWSLNNFGAGRPGYEAEQASIHSDTAATGLALLTFLGAGYHHRDDRYEEIVATGIDYLLKNQKADGDLYVAIDPTSNQSAHLYSHAIATIALCEAYGMTQDVELREAAQKAIDFAVKAQHPERGGWRYVPGRGSDTSVTGWMMMALKSGELANLDVPAGPYKKITQWMDVSQASGRSQHLYRYNPFAPDTDTQRHGRKVSMTMTSVGLLMRLYGGWNRDDELMVRGADYLLEHLPEIGTTRAPKRDTYYWYYATQVMFHMKGKYWEAWNRRLHPMLVASQVKQGPMAGSWDPRGPVPDLWGPHGGRIYVTALNLLSMEVFYRHLPIYEDTAR